MSSSGAFSETSWADVGLESDLAGLDQDTRARHTSMSYNPRFRSLGR